MAKKIKALASGAERDWSLKPESVPGESRFHQKRALAAGKRGPSPLHRTTRVVLASEVREALFGKKVTGRRRRKFVADLRNK